MIKVLIVATDHFDTGGITKIILNYYNNIDKSKFKIDFVIPNVLPHNIAQEFNKNNSKYFILNNRKKNPLKYIRQLKNIIKKENYDIVHAHGNSSTLFLEMYASYKAGCKVRISHSHNSTCNHKVINVLLYPLFNKYCNERYACGLEAGKWLFKNKEFTIIKNSIDLEKYKFNKTTREKIRKQYNLDNKTIFGHIGRFNKQKNHEFLIDIFYLYQKANPNSMLVLIGSGENLDNIKSKVKELNIEDKVIFTGEIDNVEEWMCAIDTVLLPSLYEGFPLVLIECQASAVYCIVSSNVTKKVNVTNTIDFIDLSNKDKWLKYVLNKKNINREVISKKNINLCIKSGFDIKKSAKTLEQNYIKALNKRGKN